MFEPENAQKEIQFLNRNDGQLRTWNSMDLFIPPTVYPPREDTDLLSEVLKTIPPFGTKNLLEIGSGSGALSIDAATLGWNVDACDINPFAVAATRHNAAEAGVEISVSEGGIGPQGEQSYAWQPGTYDVVLWNMPYISPDEIGDQVLGPLEEAALIDTHPEGLLTVFARTMANNLLCKMDGIALLVCRDHVGWRRSIDILRQHGLAARIVRTHTFDDDEAIHVLAAWYPFVANKHHRVREIDSTNAELLRGQYAPGDSLTAQIQTYGRGRHGRSWQDHPQSFKSSWVLDEKDLSSINLKMQLYVAHEISHALRLNKQHIEQLNIKWPNDLLLRETKDQQWRKFGGILFQSYSKGSDQRIVLGLGINTDIDNLNEGQGSLAQLVIEISNSELFAILNAVVASIFEVKHAALEAGENQAIKDEIVLKECVYRNKLCTLIDIHSTNITLEDESGHCFSVDDDAQIEWVNLHPQ
ncbi:MAG: biotin--[acetyl-CoA-carboxylase] ligase [Candidatus Thermoplasmatota archaeon]|nr:biotin--[acetyl-CoA-carboxylase] ligase [Candidatus Thermoplasmatota archaeon]